MGFAARSWGWPLNRWPRVGGLWRDGLGLLLFAATVAGLASVLLEQEQRLGVQAQLAVQEELRSLAAWQHWEGKQPPSPAQWRALPLEASSGVALVRYALSHPGRETAGFLHQLHALPWLLEHWYREIAPRELSVQEISLLALARLPTRELQEAGLFPVTPPMGLGVAPTLRAAVAALCPGGCPPLSDPLPPALDAVLLAMLESRSARMPLVALDLLVRAGPRMVEPLRERFLHARHSHTRVLAFLGLQRLLEPPEAAALRTRVLLGDDPGLKLVGALEALRSNDRQAREALRAAEAATRPAGIAVIIRHVARLLDPG